MANEKWTQLHTQLLELMKREIEIMRQLLGNLHQEELFILRKEINYWNQLMEERAHLISQLSDLRGGRLSATESLESTHPLCDEDENSWEILALRDQILALLDRMNLQASRNEMLTQLAHHQETAQPQMQQKRKISIATQTLDDYKCEDDK
ncbi:MAG: hypothetical protein ACRENF_01550 [Thermodesulfobacteriota bacterium]